MTGAAAHFRFTAFLSTRCCQQLEKRCSRVRIAPARRLRAASAPYPRGQGRTSPVAWLPRPPARRLCAGAVV